VIAQGYSVAALAANVAARRTGARTTMLVCNPMERYYRCRRDATDGAPFRRRELAVLQTVARANARLGQRYAVLSSHLADVVRGHGARCPVEVVPVYGVDPQRFHPPGESRAALRERLGLPAGGALVFFSSRLAPEKDPDTLLRAFGALVARGSDARLLYRGRGYERLVAQARGLGFAERVDAGDMVDPVEELPDLYRACDLCVQASREEGLGFSPLEALACGVPVVATAVGGLRETIVDGETGWTYPAGDVEALAEAMHDALSRPEEARRRTAAGAARVRAEFDPGRTWDRLAELVTSDG
jgi:glycosyltransferase involved in cell wall biosynthesis